MKLVTPMTTIKAWAYGTADIFLQPPSYEAMQTYETCEEGLHPNCDRYNYTTQNPQIVNNSSYSSSPF